MRRQHHQHVVRPTGSITRISIQYFRIAA